MNIIKVGDNKLNIYDYQTPSGKNLIKEFLSNLPEPDRAVGYKIRHKIFNGDLSVFDNLNTRQLQNKLWEIKFLNNRIAYVIKDEDSVYFLHCWIKQKGKAEKFELETAIKRAKENNLM